MTNVRHMLEALEHTQNESKHEQTSLKKNDVSINIEYIIVKAEQ